MAHGSILWFDSARGFGFIRPDMGPKDVFMHASALVDGEADPLEPGVKVEFELVQAGDGRLTAQHVLLLEKPQGRKRAARR
ncbi:cold shock domain-containing protein [Sandaracinobacter neustonicus]|uniref:Cold shock domain-containing protein n=1 Tax=Sandaracinobacter neustonicus TaxID=1715348 RepID=A0A501XPS4_9SPHN|nr:cold shock domain-containing protein [Sandaracinobacter neustonicus]TPE62445.1 cold shock domain-containing protein [Sandaracinobacter neustonicus]